MTTPYKPQQEGHLIQDAGGHYSQDASTHMAKTLVFPTLGAGMLLLFCF